ncbi:hypothetical protein JW905_16925 [bacterium]|nr:hypothetical protein [candidate division CSSED10-310 bacterium]
MKQLLALLFLTALCSASSAAGGLEQLTPLRPQPHPLPFVLTDWLWCPMSFDLPEGEIYPPSPNEHCELTVIGTHLHAVHYDSVFNCCIDDIEIDVTISGDTIVMLEREIWTDPCYCYCYFQTEADVYNLAPGMYRVEVWSRWMDGSQEMRCLDEVIVQ